jgi:hypothetical protein
VWIFSFKCTSQLPSAVEAVFLGCGHLPLRDPAAKGQVLLHQLLVDVVVDGILSSAVHPPPLLSLPPASLSTLSPTKPSARAKQHGKQQRCVGADELGRKWQRGKLHDVGSQMRDEQIFGVR